MLCWIATGDVLADIRTAQADKLSNCSGSDLLLAPALSEVFASTCQAGGRAVFLWDYGHFPILHASGENQ